jgi:serine/threonine protein kinase
MVSRNMKRTQLGFLLIVMFLVSFAPASTATVEPEQTTVDRTFSWSVNGNIRCPGNVAQCDLGVSTGYLASQDFAISTGAAHFDISFLETSCSVHNNGPQDAAFDVGVVFGPSLIGFGPAGARPEQALGVYHGVAFGWVKAVLSKPDWSIDFHTGQTKAGGAPVLSTKWLSPTGNVFEGSGMVHLMISVWSGAPTNFDLSVAACSVHVVFDASGVAQGSKISTSTQQTSSGIAGTQTTYVIAIPGVAFSMVASPQAVASEITSVAYGKGLTVQVVSSYDQLDSLVRDPPSNVIVINAHGETVPMPASWGTSWQTYYDRLASDVSNQGWTFVSIAGYPLYWTISPIQPNPPAPGEAGLRRFLTGVGGQGTTAWAATTSTLTSAGSQAASYYGLSFPSTQSFARAVDWQGVTPIVTFYDDSSPVGASAIKMGNGYFITIGLSDQVSDQLKADMGIAFASITPSIPSFLTLTSTHLATSISTQQQQTSSGIAGTETTSATAAVNVLGSDYILYFVIGLVGVFAPITAYVVTRKGKRRIRPEPDSRIQTTDHDKKETEAHREGQLKGRIPKMSEVTADSLRPGFEFVPDTSPSDRMRVLQSIEGGQGRIIVVANTSGDRFAVKTFKYAEDPHDYKKIEKRFYHEAALWVGLGKHPNIVRALSFGKMSDDPYLLLEFVDGVNLRKLITSRQLDLRRSLQIGKDVCSGLMYAHTQGVVHGDVKPENILMDRSGRAKVTDFGCSRLSGETGTLSVDVIATLSYMSPEQLFSESEIDERSDIYSFGVVLYEMLTYQNPFRSGTVKEVLNAHHAHIPVPSSVQMGIPREIDRLVLCCIERNPDERFHHFGELVAILEKYSSSF